MKPDQILKGMRAQFTDKTFSRIHAYVWSKSF